MQPKSLPTRLYVPTRCYISSSSIGKSVLLRFRQTVYIGRNAVIYKYIMIFTQGVSKLTSVCIGNAGCYYYYYYHYHHHHHHYPILTTSCDVFTDINVSEIYQILRNILQLIFSLYLNTEGQTDKHTQ
jgi:hypothetical protein